MPGNPITKMPERRGMNGDPAIPSVSSWFTAKIREFGADRWILVRDRGEFVVTAGTYEEGWRNYYRQSGYCPHDPIMRVGFGSDVPVFSGDLALLNDKEKAVMDARYALGPWSALVVPTRIDGKKEFVIIAFDQSPEEVRETVTIFNYDIIAFSHYLAIYGRIPARNLFRRDGLALTAQQEQVASGLLKGKHLAVIAEDLGVTERTVRHHVAEMKRALVRAGFVSGDAKPALCAAAAFRAGLVPDSHLLPHATVG